VIILAQLAVDNAWQGRGLGAALVTVTDAMRRILQAADIAGVRAMLVHAKDDAMSILVLNLSLALFVARSIQGI
jgi:GNAT superfamily N-acetyltransferase